MRHTLFVYGSLKRGFRHHRMLEGAEPAGSAHTGRGYALVQYGEYPGLVERGDGVVAGELYVVDDALLAELDEFEGVPALYRRASVRLKDGTLALAYVVAQAGDFALLPDGWQRD